MALPASFYRRPVVTVARELIGCRVDHGDCGGVIVETEAYHDSEPACHGFGGQTPRTQVLFGPAGLLYVYRSYGIHALLNVACEREGVGAAVLVRALLADRGIAAMRERRGGRPDGELCDGPGKLTQALAITLAHNGLSAVDGPIRISRGRQRQHSWSVVAGPRIGITKAVDLPWRFAFADCKAVSRPRPPLQ